MQHNFVKFFFTIEFALIAIISATHRIATNNTYWSVLILFGLLGACISFVLLSGESEGEK